LQVIDYAISVHGQGLVDDHIKSASQGAATVENIRAVLYSQQQTLTGDQRVVVARAAGGKNGWFKSVGDMEHVAKEILAPNFAGVTEGFKARVNNLLIWAQTVHG
jgi:hypothetical protein|tara:strand:+ start:325 stop:639 length:315 start_codon:yes stop_codon:yes gene_type:complete